MPAHSARVNGFGDRVSLVAETTARFPAEIGRTSGGRCVAQRRQRRGSHHRTDGRGYFETRRLLPSGLERWVRVCLHSQATRSLFFAVPLGEAL